METTSEIRGPTVVLVGQLIDGTGAEPRRNVGLIVEDGVITCIDEVSRIPRASLCLISARTRSCPD